MGQFLGFSDDPSPLVLNVSNLRTSYISPQFHVVFDDLFQTTLSLCDYDLVVNAICNQFFENSCNTYDEDEFSMDKELIYFPPPLDEVCLFESETQERREKMCA